MIKINLLPKELQEKGKGLDWIILGYGVILFFALMGMSLYSAKLQSYNKDIIRKKRWSAQLSEIKTKVARVEQLDAQKALLNAKKNTVTQLFQGRILYPVFMDCFFRIIPKEIWISDITLTEDQQKNISVIAMSNSLSTNSIADWLQTLESKPDMYSGVSLSAIDVKQPPEKDKAATFGFSLTFTFHPPADPAKGS